MNVEEEILLSALRRRQRPNSMYRLKVFIFHVMDKALSAEISCTLTGPVK